MITRATTFLVLFFSPLLAEAQNVPGCALTGSSTVMIGGKAGAPPV